MVSKKGGDSKMVESMVGDWGGQLYLNSRVRHYYHRRCKRARPTDIDCLPDDLLSSILVFLPADYLHHTASLVCQRWSHIIRSDAFVNKQIQHSKYGLLLARDWEITNQFFARVSQGGRVETTEICHRFRSPQVKTSFNGFVITRGSPRGTRSMIVTNLATKESFNTPRFPFFSYSDLMAVGFAVDSNKYKVVAPYWTGERDTRLTILTIGVDKDWRTDVGVDHLPKSDRLAMFEAPLVTEGFMHWAKYENIITLDVESERLMMFSRPLFLRRGALFYLSTGRFLSLLVCKRDLLFEVWGMESRSGEWKKMLPDIDMGALKGKLQQLTKTGRREMMPLGWVNYPEVLAFYHFYDGWTCTCIFYNLYTHEIDSTELPYPVGTVKAFVHKDTVVRLK